MAVHGSFKDNWLLVLQVFTRMTLANAGISCRHVCPSVTSRCFTETAKRKITQTMPHNRPGTLVFCCWKSWQNSNAVSPNGGAKCRWGRLNAGAVAANWQLSMRSIVNLVRSQVCHTGHPSYLFAARSSWCSALRGFVCDSWWTRMSIWHVELTCLFSSTLFVIFLLHKFDIGLSFCFVKKKMLHCDFSVGILHPVHDCVFCRYVCI